MKKLYLIQNPELFQGEKQINQNKNYFEGWYFKNTNGKDGISFIPGINIESNNQKAFIQVITNTSSYFVNYSIKKFEFNFNPFSIKIDNNIFSKEGLHIDIEDETQKIRIFGDIKYLDNKNIKTNAINPNIMGPFSYIPFMECNHAILSMQNYAQGLIKLNNEEINFNGIGYIEKDWGCSFPKNYIWAQGNNFQNSNASFMISVADIPLKLFNFRGFICALIVGKEEFKFTTYNNAKILQYEISNKDLNITLKKGSYELSIKSKLNDGLKLIAPVKGKMQKDIFESITSIIKVTLKKDKNIIFSDISTNCGLEIVL